MTNSFVRTNTNNFGIGKVIVTYGDRVTVEYFISVNRRKRLELARSAVHAVEPLPQHTNCYFVDDSGNWGTGVVEGRSGETYRLKSPDETTIFVPRNNLFARCRIPSPDPLDALVNYCFTHASLHDRRHEFVRYGVGARAATLGLTGLSSSRISLYAHQIEVTRRVLEDPVQRYLLADEVGLGKTIEAGIVLRQFLLDNPHEQALLIVPTFLLDQWRFELLIKFTLGDLGAKRVTRVSADELPRMRLQERFGLLIVDEAHHAAAGAFSSDPLSRRRYATLRRFAHDIPRVLLLSATPVLHHEQDFLAMLHLLDPCTYKLEELEAFRARVSSRQVVGKVLLLLREKTSPFIARQLLGDLDGLAKSFVTDAHLLTLISSLRDALTNEDISQEYLDAVIRPVRVHISETYRLHRRLLRTRRDSMNGELLAVRVGCEAIQNTSIAAATVEEYLEQWRQGACECVSHASSAVEQKFIDVYQMMVQASGSWEPLLEEVLTSRIELRPTSILTREMGNTAAALSQLPLFEGEAALLQGMREIVRSADRIGVLLAVLQERSDAIGKTVIFATSRGASAAIAERLEKTFGISAVARHLSEQSAESIEETVRRFRDAQECHFLVCDQSGEEGRNLQFVDQIIHFDLPASPNRVEQRIGRVDRIGRVEAIRMYAVIGSTSDHSPHAAWYRVLGEGFGVFSESIAGLQFLVDRTMPGLLRTLFREGAAGLLNCLEGVQRDIAEEKQRNAEQSALDELEGSVFSGRDYIRKLEEFDADAGSIQRAVERWVCEGLGFQRELLDPEKRTVRYRAGAKTKVAADLLEELAPLLGTTGTYDRVVATAARTLRLFRPGEPFLDAMARNAELDDRGRAFAIWRWDQNMAAEGKEWTGFRFTFVVEAEVGAAEAVFAAAERQNPTRRGQILVRADRRALHRHADALFPAWLQTMYVDTDGRLEEDERMLARLRRPIQHEVTEGLQDFMLWTSLRVALDEIVDPGRWSTVCISAKEAAERFLRQSDAFQARLKSRYEQAEGELSRRLDQLRARGAVEAKSARGLTITSQDIAHEQKLVDVLLTGMRVPRVRVDSAGFVILSGRKPPGVV